MIAWLRDESGIGLPVTMGVLAVVLIIGGWTVSNADQLHRASERDRGAKRALGPADAALDRASWKLGTSTVAATQCITSTAAGETVGACGATPAPTSMGNGVEYSYQVSAQHSSPGTCANMATVAGDRCVTATGTANGVSRRVQAILRRPVVDLIFKHRGMVGKSWVKTGNNVTGVRCANEPQAELGTNGNLDLGGGNNVAASGCGGSGGYKVHATSHSGSAAGSGTITPRSPQYELPPVQIPGDAASWLAANQTITGSGFQWIGGIAKRNLNITGNVELRGGTYNFCQLVQDSGSLTVRPGELAKIYIDSPDRPGSGCDAGTGGFWIQNNEEMNWGSDLSAPLTSQAANGPATRAQWLRVYVYGSTAWENTNRSCNGNKAGAVLICNSSKFAGTIYAPSSKVVVSNSSQIVGAISSDKLEFENGVSFRVPDGLGEEVIGQTVGDARPAQWTECRSNESGTTC